MKRDCIFELNMGNGCLPTSETVLLNEEFNSTVINIVSNIKSLADKLVENEGYILIRKCPKWYLLKDLKKLYNIIYIPVNKNGLTVILCNSNNHEMLRFNDTFHDDKLHEDLFGQKNPSQKIASSLIRHYMIKK